MPPELRQIVGKREITRTLGTKDPEEAKRKAKRIGIEIDQKFEAARRELAARSASRGSDGAAAPADLPDYLKGRDIVFFGALDPIEKRLKWVSGPHPDTPLIDPGSGYQHFKPQNVIRLPQEHMMKSWKESTAREFPYIPVLESPDILSKPATSEPTTSGQASFSDVVEAYLRERRRRAGMRAAA